MLQHVFGLEISLSLLVGECCEEVVWMLEIGIGFMIMQWPHWVLEVIWGTGEEVPFMGGRLVDPMRRCLAVCPDMPCGVQMAGWNERREGHTILWLLVRGTGTAVLITCSPWVHFSLFLFSFDFTFVDFFLCISVSYIGRNFLWPVSCHLTSTKNCRPATRTTETSFLSLLSQDMKETTSDIRETVLG